MKKRLDLELVKRNLFASRNAAQQNISSGNILVNHSPAQKANMMVEETDTIEVKNLDKQFVSRAGAKLEAAIIKWHIDFTDKVIVDVGASTGGFTDCALSHDARRVYAIDVGKDQLVPQLKNDPRVVSLEKTDVRKVSLPEKCDIALVDVSFISLTKVLERVRSLVSKNGSIIALVKPQFEVGKEIADRHKGIICDDAEREKALRDVIAYAESIKLSIVDSIESPIAGTDGNREYLLYLKNS